MIEPLAVSWPLESIWTTATGFIAIMVLLVGFIGLASKTLSVAAYGSYMMFSYYAATADIELLTTIAFVTHTLVAIGVAFKLWRLEGGGEI